MTMFTDDQVLAAARAYHSLQCQTYDHYDGASRARSPKFCSADLLDYFPRQASSSKRTQALACLRHACASLEARGLLLRTGSQRSRPEYCVMTGGVRAEADARVREHEEAEGLARMLGGQAEHYTRGSYVTFTVEQTRKLLLK